MEGLWREFSQVAVAHLLAVASPGPDFAIVLRQAIVHNRRVAVWTSLGIGAGILVHVTASLLGIGLLIRSSLTAFTVLKYLGAGYLAWIGLRALRPGARPVAGGGEPVPRGPLPGAAAALVTGFLTNVLNPKATLFFVALFSVVVDPKTPLLIQAGYGLWMTVATAGWFIFVAFVFTQLRVRQAYFRHGHWMDRAMGVFFLGLAVSLALSSFT